MVKLLGSTLKRLHNAALVCDQSSPLRKKRRPHAFKFNVDCRVLQLLPKRFLRLYDKFHEDALFVHSSPLLLVGVEDLLVLRQLLADALLGDAVIADDDGVQG